MTPPDPPPPGRALAPRWHALVAAVALVALVLQLVLVVDGAATLLPETQPSLVTRLVRFVSYFTVLSNVGVALTEARLSRPGAVGRVWRVGRLVSVVAIAVTALVHYLWLRPLLDLSGGPWVADRLLHVVVPVLCVGGWVAVGPRGLVAWSDLPPALVLPGLWLAWTLVHGALTGWYPYPFVDVSSLGYARVAVNGLGVAGLLVALAALAVWGDAQLSRGASGTTPRRPTDRT